MIPLAGTVSAAWTARNRSRCSTRNTLFERSRRARHLREAATADLGDGSGVVGSAARYGTAGVNVSAARTESNATSSVTSNRNKPCCSSERRRGRAMPRTSSPAAKHGSPRCRRWDRRRARRHHRSPVAVEPKRVACGSGRRYSTRVAGGTSAATVDAGHVLHRFDEPPLRQPAESGARPTTVARACRALASALVERLDRLARPQGRRIDREGGKSGLDIEPARCPEVDLEHVMRRPKGTGGRGRALSWLPKSRICSRITSVASARQRARRRRRQARRTSASAAAFAASGGAGTAREEKALGPTHSWSGSDDSYQSLASAGATATDLDGDDAMALPAARRAVNSANPRRSDRPAAAHALGSWPAASRRTDSGAREVALVGRLT